MAENQTPGQEPFAGDGIATALRDFANMAIDAENQRCNLLEEFDAIALPGGYTLHSLEKLSPFRSRSRGVYETQSLDDFARAANEPDDRWLVRTFIDAEQWSATAVLNWHLKEGSFPGHCDYLARLDVKPTPEWEALLRLHGAKFTQRGLIEFIEDWPQAIPGFNDKAGGSVTTPAALAAIRSIETQASKLTFNRAEEMKTERGVLDAIEARQLDAWPSVMGWACTPALGMPPIAATVRLSILTAQTPPMIATRVIGYEALRDQTARNFALLLNSKLDSPGFAGRFDAGE
jgi:uncharacterized protein YfdQ (DUF2303 family)